MLRLERSSHAIECTVHHLQIACAGETSANSPANRQALQATNRLTCRSSACRGAGRWQRDSCSSRSACCSSEIRCCSCASSSPSYTQQKTFRNIT